MNSFRRDIGGVSLPSEFWSECHLDEELPELRVVAYMKCNYNIEDVNGGYFEPSAGKANAG